MMVSLKIRMNLQPVGSEFGQVVDSLTQGGGCRAVGSDELVEGIGQHEHGRFVVLLDFCQIGEAPSGHELTREDLHGFGQVEGPFEQVSRCTEFTDGRLAVGEVSQGLHLPHIVLHGDEQFQSFGANGDGRVLVMLTLGNGHQQGHAVGHPFLVFDGLANPEGVLSSGPCLVELSICKVEQGQRSG